LRQHLSAFLRTNEISETTGGVNSIGARGNLNQRLARSNLRDSAVSIGMRCDKSRGLLANKRAIRRVRHP
jgi:hypothetical protein